jgi:hypothetical protein
MIDLPLVVSRLASEMLPPGVLRRVSANRQRLTARPHAIICFMSHMQRAPMIWLWATRLRQIIHNGKSLTFPYE